MIKILTGKPGSGKSYTATALARQEMIRGKKVFSNVNFSFKHKGLEYTNYQLDKEDIKKNRFPNNSLLIIDEAGFWFNSRNFKEFDLEDFMFFSQHRHLGIDIILVVQNMNRIDKSLRELADLIYINVNYLKFVFIQYKAWGLESYEKEDISFNKIYLLRNKIASSYNTNQCLENFQNRDEFVIKYDYNSKKVKFSTFIKQVFKKRHDIDLRVDYTRPIIKEKKWNVKYDNKKNGL